jgi:hypothetical protein
MATDTRCPACGAATPFGQVAAVSVEARAVIDPGARRRFFVTKWVRALFLFVAGGVAMAAGVLMYLEAQSDNPTARNVTAADLLRIDNPESLPDWISYSPTKTLDTGIEYVKTVSRQTTSKFLLLQVGDHWLLTQVPGHFKGSRVEGKLGRPDRVALPKVLAAFPDKAARLLPYQLEAKIDIAGTQRRSFGYAVAVGVFGLLMFSTGVRGFFAKPPPFLGTATEEPVRHTPREPAYRFLDQASPQPSYQPERPPRRRRWAVRVFFGVVWAVVFFLAAAAVVSLLVVQGAGDDPEVRQQLAQEAGQKQGPLVLLGTVVLTTVLGCLGWLPGTRR